MDAVVSTNPPAYTTLGATALSQTPTGGLRSQLQDGAGHDVSTTYPFPVSAKSITTPVLVAENTTVAAASGFTILVSVAGSVTLTLSGGTIIINPVAGADNIYPYAVTKWVSGTATVTRAYNLS